MELFGGSVSPAETLTKSGFCFVKTCGSTDLCFHILVYN
jgi:hypothetical protein